MKKEHLLMIYIFVVSLIFGNAYAHANESDEIYIYEGEAITCEDYTIGHLVDEIVADTISEYINTHYIPYSEEEVELIALLTLGEAEGESEYGQRLVVDTVLNRLDSSYFPDTINEVVYQKGQYSAIRSKKIRKMEVSDELRELVKEEMRNRSNSEVIFFKTGSYHNRKNKLFKEGKHYFCGL